MQPYLFPYLGYYQLFHATNTFVSLDDVPFIKKGWINRNRILLQGNDHLFTVPISGQSQNVSIRDSMVASEDGWRKKLLNTMTHAYRKAPCFESVFPIVERVLSNGNVSIADMAEESLRSVMNHLGLPSEILHASELDIDPDLHGQSRIMAICARLQTSLYVNPSGGRTLYEPDVFARHGMDLRFLRMVPVKYDQGGSKTFQPALSMIDILMWNSKDEVLALMAAYALEQ